jgi:hypothetical protein
VTNTLKEYDVISETISKYDMNTICHRNGDLYCSIFKFFLCCIKDTAYSYLKFEELNNAQLFHLSLLLVKEVNCQNSPNKAVFPE